MDAALQAQLRGYSMTRVPLQPHPDPLVLNAAETIAHFRGDLHAGLTSTEANRRLSQFGYNVLPRHPGPDLWIRFLLLCRNVQVYWLLAATVVSLLVWAMEHAGGTAL